MIESSTYYYNEYILKCRLILDKIQELLNAKYPTCYPYVILKLMNLFYENKVKNVSIDSDSEEPIEDATSTKFYKSQIKLVMDVYSKLRFFEGAENSNVPYQLVKIFEKFASRYTSISDCRPIMILRRQWNSNYKNLPILNSKEAFGQIFYMTRTFLQNYLTEFNQIISEYFDDLVLAIPELDNAEEDQRAEIVYNSLIKEGYFVSFPSCEKKNLFSLCIIAHEIGHSIDTHFKIPEKSFLDHVKDINIQDTNTSFSEKIVQYIMNKKKDIIENIRVKLDQSQLIYSIRSNEINDDVNNDTPDYSMILRNFLCNERNIKNLETDTVGILIYWISEIIADLIALRIFSYGYLLSFHNFVSNLHRQENKDENYMIKRKHPPNMLRRDIMLHILDKEPNSFTKSSITNLLKNIIKEISQNKSVYNDVNNDTLIGIEPEFHNEFTESKQFWFVKYKIIQELMFDENYDLINHIYEDIKRNVKCNVNTNNIATQFENLKNGILPCDNWPIEKVHTSDRIPNFESLFNAAWLYKLDNSEIQEFNMVEKCERISRFVLKATEYGTMFTEYLNLRNLNDRVEKFTEELEQLSKSIDPESGMLSKNELIERMFVSQEDKIVVTPIFNFTQLKDKCIEIRIGNEFITFFDSGLPILDYREIDKRKIAKYFRRHHLKYNEDFVIQQNQFVLGITLEYISLPKDIVCKFHDRKSWSRSGLHVTTSVPLISNYKGMITLEIFNRSPLPIVLRPGDKIGFLTFQSLSKHNQEYYSQYSFDEVDMYATSPIFSKMF